MVATPIEPQRLSARSGGDWGTMQIATPAIVGGGLILVFTAYIIWQRRHYHQHPYDYHRVRREWTAKIERMFVPRRTRKRVYHSSDPITIDDSMRTSVLAVDFRRARQYRSDSSDSQTPLTATSYPFDYPPGELTDSPPPVPKHRSWRWWRILGSRAREVKSEEPGSLWRVDGPDGSSSGHGHSSHGHEDIRTRYVEALEPVNEEQNEDEDSVIRIGGDFTSIASTPLTQQFPEPRQAVREMSTVLEHPGSPGVRTPLRAASALPSVAGTPHGSSTNLGLPPSYETSQGLARHPSSDGNLRQARSYSPYRGTPPPTRAAGYSPRAFHGRELSSDSSFLAAQPPMVTTSLY